MEVTVAAVNVVEPDIPLKDAPMVLWPAATEVAAPTVVIVAIWVFDELQAARAVRSWVTLFVRTPMALNCLVVPTMLVESAGVTAMESSAAEVNVDEPETFPEDAIIVVEPGVIAVTIPFDPSELPAEATPLFDELHTTDSVMSRAEPSEKNPDALNFTVVPGAIVVLGGVTEMDVRVTGVDLLPPHPARTRTDIITTKQLTAMQLKAGERRIEAKIILNFTKDPHRQSHFLE